MIFHFLRSFVRLIDGLEIDLLPRIARAVRQDLVDLAPKMLVYNIFPREADIQIDFLANEG